ncbi:hypothetical protein BCR42DRAFT_418867 [Absidia repens]|uniref:Galactose oxidase n=1 Tax=Absidia repens TaxID=90262 RepID=A0A1X2ICK1_9FUNG|nr:hypothetical protein BCR42DRAFT_418867 [Absidia repens]
MIRSFLFYFVVVCLFHIARSDSLPKIYKHGCVILANQKIYCHGGATRSAPTTTDDTTYFNDTELYNQHVYLDVSHPLNLSAANTQWQSVPPPIEPFNLERRADFAMVAVNDTTFLISGGIGPSTTPGNQSLAQIAIRYNAELNLWTPIRSQNSSSPKLNFTFDTQLFGGRGVKISEREFMINGGIPPNNNTVIDPNTTYVDVESTGDHWSSMQAWTIPISRGGGVIPDRSRIFRACSALGGDGVVYFFGGVLPMNATDNYNFQDNMGYYSFDKLLAFFPSKNQTFDVVDTGSSDNAPTYRQLHTATSLPNTNLILIYGGIGGQGASLDFSWTYDITARKWKTTNFTNGDGPGRRFGHQSVMVGNDMLYIIGGIDSTGTTQNDVNILNVTSMTWLEGSYTNTYDQQLADAANNGGLNGGSLSGGAIAGIVIGCVAALAIIVAAIVIIRVQRKKKGLMASGSAPAGFNSDPPPMMTSTKEYNMAPPTSPFDDDSTTVYSSKPYDGTFDHMSAPSSKPHVY